jgi:hypothetical protein
VPDVAFNLGILKAGDEPRAGIEARTLPTKDRIAGLVQFVLERLKSGAAQAGRTSS